MRPYSVDLPGGSAKKPEVPPAKDRVPNPYRAPRPKDLLFKGLFEIRPEGNSLGFDDQPIHLTLSSLYLWFSDGSSIPLAAINDLSLVQGDSFLKIEFWHSHSEQTGVLLIRPRKFMNVGAKSLLREFESALRASWKRAPKRAEFFGTKENPSRYITGGCEKGDAREARPLSLTSYWSMGIPVVFYASRTQKVEHLLCQVHGERLALRVALQNGLRGYLGLGGVVFAPMVAFQNAAALVKAYPRSSKRAAVLLFGFALPLLGIVAAILFYVAARNGLTP